MFTKVHKMVTDPLSASIVQKCKSQLPDLLSNTSDLSNEEKTFVRCQYCFLNDSELEELFTFGKCFPSDYSNSLTFVLIMYAAILIVALPGNIFVVITVGTFRKLHSVTHFFIANLAIGDLLMTVFCVPFSVISIIVLQYWPFGEVLCVAVNYIQAVSVFVSAYTLVAISIDRYLAIMYPLRPRISSCQAKVIIVSVWVMAFATTMPVAIFSKLVAPEDERIYAHFRLKVCQEKWPQVNLAKTYTLALMLLQYFFPLVVLLFTYCRIACQVWGTSRAKSEELRRRSNLSRSFQKSSSSVLRNCASDHSPAKMIRMTLTVVLVYSLCWLPFNILQVVRDYCPEVHEWSYMHILWVICHWLAMSHTCYNPLILCWMNAKFRTCLVTVVTRKLLCCGCCFESVLRKHKLQLSSSYPHSSPSLRRAANTSTTSVGISRCRKDGITRHFTRSSSLSASQKKKIEAEIFDTNSSKSSKISKSSKTSANNDKLEMIILDSKTMELGSSLRNVNNLSATKDSKYSEVNSDVNETDTIKVNGTDSRVLIEGKRNESQFRELVSENNESIGEDSKAQKESTLFKGLNDEESLSSLFLEDNRG